MFEPVSKQSNNQNKIQNSLQNQSQEKRIEHPKDVESSSKKGRSKSLKFKSKKIVWSVAAVIILVLAGVGGWWYYAKGQAMLLVNQAQINWGQANHENFHQDMYLDISMQALDTDIDFQMPIPVSLPDTIHLNLVSSQDTIGLDMEGNFGFLFSSDSIEGNVEANIDYKKLEDAFYFKPIVDATYISSFPIAREVRDNWYKIEFSQDLPIDFDPEEDLSKDKINDYYKDLNNFFDNIKEKNIFEIEDPHQEDQIGGKELKKIQIIFKADKLDDLAYAMTDFMADLKDLTEQDREEYIQEKNNDIKERISQEPEKWQDYQKYFVDTEFFLWIDKDSKMIQALGIKSKDIKIENSYSPTYLVDIELTYTLHDIESRQIKEPENFKNWKDLVNIFMGRPLPSSDSPSGHGIDVDNDGLLMQQEIMLGTDPNNPDTDGDGFLDGEEVNNGYNPLGDGEIPIPDFEGEYLYSQEDLCLFSGGGWENEYCKCGEDSEFDEELGCIKYFEAPLIK